MRRSREEFGKKNSKRWFAILINGISIDVDNSWYFGRIHKAEQAINIIELYFAFRF
jgi:hypothetical protein